MEELIREIERAESEAAKIKAEATQKAADIISALDKEIDSLKKSYERKLKDDSTLVLAQTKQKISDLAREEDNATRINIKRTEDNARDKIPSCVDFVYDYLLKEFN